MVVRQRSPFVGKFELVVKLASFDESLDARDEKFERFGKSLPLRYVD